MTTQCILTHMHINACMVLWHLHHGVIKHHPGSLHINTPDRSALPRRDEMFSSCLQGGGMKVRWLWGHSQVCFFCCHTSCYMSCRMSNTTAEKMYKKICVVQCNDMKVHSKTWTVGKIEGLPTVEATTHMRLLKTSPATIFFSFLN